MIYLDYAANTPIEKEVLDTYYQATMKYFANPNASHTLGLQAKEVIDQTTKHIAEQLHVLPEEIIYTSGASEANNLAIKGILERYKHRGKHVLISPLEHNSILSSLTKMQENGFIVEMIPLKEDGQVNVEKMKSMIQEDTILVREGIKLGLPTVSMEEAIVAAGELLRDLGYVDDDYIPAMIRRNEEASVYMGLGLAIPHGTEDAKRNVKKSGIIVMQYPDGVEFNGGTAQLVIGIAGVGDEHLEILGQITEAVTEEEILEELKKTTDVDYILKTFANME